MRGGGANDVAPPPLRRPVAGADAGDRPSPFTYPASRYTPARTTRTPQPRATPERLPSETTDWALWAAVPARAITPQWQQVHEVEAEHEEDHGHGHIADGAEVAEQAAE